MLEDTRKRGASIMIYLIFGLLIVIFAISFGPQNFGQGQGCSQGTQGTTMTIAGEPYGMNTWRWALNNMRSAPYQTRATWALDGILRREMLAQEAEERGLVISDDVIDEKLKAGEFYILSQKVDGKPRYYEDGEYFNYDLLLANVVRPVGLTINTFKQEQRRELMAAAMERILASGAHVSRDEVFALW